MLFVLALAALMPLAAFASPTVNVTFTGAPVSAYGYGVGLYDCTVNGVSTKCVCDDFETLIGVDQTWKAFSGTTNPIAKWVLFDGTDVAVPLPGEITQQQDYNMIGWLAGQIKADPTNSKGKWGVESWSLWALNDPTAWSDAKALGISGDVQTLLNTAYGYRNEGSNLIVLTPTPWNAGQEFLTSTPELDTWLLAFIGVTLYYGSSRIRRHLKPAPNRS